MYPRQGLLNPVFVPGQDSTRVRSGRSDTSTWPNHHRTTDDACCSRLDRDELPTITGDVILGHATRTAPSATLNHSSATGQIANDEVRSPGAAGSLSCGKRTRASGDHLLGCGTWQDVTLGFAPT